MNTEQKRRKQFTAARKRTAFALLSIMFAGFVTAAAVPLAAGRPTAVESGAYTPDHKANRLDALSRVVAQTQYGFDLPRVAKIRGPLIVRELWAYRANGETKQPDWLVFNVVAERFVDSPTRARGWKNATCIDPRFVLEARPDDFDGVGGSALPADRGHGNALKHVANHPAWKTCNEYGNIFIESPGANRGPILRIEERCRDLDREGHRPFCVKLPVWDHPDVEPNQTPVLPNADETYKSPEAIAYVVRFPRGSAMSDSVYCWIVPQTAKQTDPARKYATSFDQVEEMTGVKL